MGVINYLDSHLVEMGIEREREREKKNATKKSFGKKQLSTGDLQFIKACHFVTFQLTQKPLRSKKD